LDTLNRECPRNIRYNFIK